MHRIDHQISRKPDKKPSTGGNNKFQFALLQASTMIQAMSIRLAG